MAQSFRQTLVAKLTSISDLTAIVGAAIFADALPQTHDLGRNGPALTFTIVSYPRGMVMGGLDGTGTPRIQFSAWAYSKASSDAITLVLLGSLTVVPPANPWGDGTITILSCTHQDESDQSEPPPEGGDQWIYQIVSEYQVKHRL